MGVARVQTMIRSAYSHWELHNASFHNTAGNFFPLFMQKILNSNNYPTPKVIAKPVVRVLFKSI